MSLLPLDELGLENLARDVAAELAHAGRDTLAELAKRSPAQARRIAALMDRLGRLAAQAANGEDVDASLEVIRARLKQREAIGAIIISRAADQLMNRGLQVAGVFASRAGEILAKFAVGLALGAIAL